MEQIFEFGNYSIFTKNEGHGPPLLLLHSYWGGQILFDKMAFDFSKTRNLIRIDLPGHGKSGPPPADYSFESFATVLNELLIRLKITEKISIVGHSMGGYAALAFVRKYPERIASLVIMHAPVKEAEMKSVKLRNREAQLIKKGRKDLLLQLTIPSNFAPGNSEMMVNELRLLYNTANQVTIEGALGSIRAMNHRANNLEVLKKRCYPILIIVGKYDKVYSAEGQVEDANQIPGAEVLLLEHSGHLGFLEEEEIVLARLKSFLAVES